MTRFAQLLFGIVAYAVFLLTFLYLIAFVGTLPIVPRTVDYGGPVIAPWGAAAIDLCLVALFAVQHSVMARPGFKRWWTRMIPAPVERSVYVLVASLALIVLFAGWHPIPALVWSVAPGPGAVLLWILFATGWGIVLLSTFLISHFELFGLTQVWLNLRGRVAAEPVFRQPFFYRLVRHPLYTGFFIAFWATPVMSLGHLVLAGGMSAFMLIAIRFEEHDLTDLFGQAYRDYRARTGMLMPRILRRPDA